MTASHASRWAGPDALGRGLLVAPGAVVPAPWLDAPRRIIDKADVDDPGEAVAWLQQRWSGRERFVLELHVAVAETKAPQAELRPVWELGPGFSFLRERLHHLVWANAVDARQPGRPRWVWAEKAVALGAKAEGRADVGLADGSAAWCDGGPLGPIDLADGALLIPRVALERDRLTPIVDAEARADLAPDQLAAVAHRAGGARIIAPAGSGKTRVLTERARLLLRDRHVPASAVQLVAYNTRAAREMRERTTDVPGLRVDTLNALGLAILQGRGPFRLPVGRSGRSTVLDEREVRRILDGLVAPARRANADPIAAWIEALGVARLGLVPPHEVEALYRGEVDGFEHVFERYRHALAERDALDFDEQIVGAIEVLLADPDARQAAQRACRVLLVDEFQDLTPAHVLLVRILASPLFDVFGVGDDDQTIYGYNGASPEWLLAYDRYVPAATVHALEVNYRCPPAVIVAASNLLAYNSRRVAKSIRPAPGRVSLPGDFDVQVVDDPIGATVAAVGRSIDRGASPADVAVLARVNVVLAPVQVALQLAGIPCTVVVDRSFCERTGVQAALAWLRIGSAPEKLSGRDLDAVLRRVAKRPSPKMCEWIAEKRSVTDLVAMANRLQDDRLDAVVDAVESVVAACRRSTAAALAVVRSRTGLASTMSALDTAAVGRNRGGHGDDLAALETLARFEPDAARFGGWLRDALPERSGGEAADPGLTGTGPKPVVTLSTVHRVKGQEWPVVVVHEVAADQFPHRLAEDREEERRVFHVAITRASQRCVVVAPAGSPSPFLLELAAAPSANQRRAAASTGAQVPAASSKPSKPSKSSAPPPRAAPDQDAIDDRYTRLKLWRGAARNGKPAYTVLPDASLTWIAEHLPTTLEELAACPGVGPTRLDRYGSEILAILDGGSP